MIAAGKSEIREWFKKGVKKKCAYMMIIYDRMGYPDNPDFPLYADTDEELSDKMRAFRFDELSEIMEVYDLLGDMEAQLNEKRAWHVPDSLADDEPVIFAADGSLSSGMTRMEFMLKQNSQFIKELFEEATNITAYPAHVFTDSTKEHIYSTCVYIIERDDYAEKTIAAVYRFFEDNTAKAYDILLLQDEEGEEKRFTVQFPLRHQYSVMVDGPYIKFSLVHAGGKDKNSSLYKQLLTSITRVYSEKYDRYGHDNMSGGYHLDEQSERIYLQAMDLLNAGDKGQAVELLEEITLEGHAEAMYQLGEIFYEDSIEAEAHEGADNIKDKAIQYWKNAAVLGHEKSAQLVELLTKSGEEKIGENKISEDRISKDKISEDKISEDKISKDKNHCKEIEPLLGERDKPGELPGNDGDNVADADVNIVIAAAIRKLLNILEQ